MDAEALDQRLHREGRLAIEDAVGIARQIAAALDDVHARGILHRDLKPATILVDRNGNAYFRAFGLFGMAPPSMAPDDVPYSGPGMDMLEYLSPEQVRDEKVGVYTDLYALGLILYEMLIGGRPFGSIHNERARAARLYDGPPPVREKRPEVPSWLARLVERLLCPRPEHRVHSAAEVVTTIDRCAVLLPPWLVRLQPKHMGWVGNSVAALLALAIGGAAWQVYRYQVSASVPPPLQRLLVQPITRQGGEATLDDRIAGLSAHLRDALAAHVAVVDGERTEQLVHWLYLTDRTPHDPAALRIAAPSTPVPPLLLDGRQSSSQVGLPTHPPKAQRRDAVAPPNLATLRATAAANRVLQPRLIADGGRWRLQADLYTNVAKPQRIDGATAADPVAALRAGLPALTAALGLRATDLNLALPAHPAALDTYGAALRTRWRRGPGQAAVAALRRVTQVEPSYAAAWLALAEAAQAAGEDPIAYEAIARGQRVVAKAPQPLQARFEAVKALLAGDAPAAIAQWRALSAALPDDGFATLNLARAQAAGGDLNAAVASLRALTARDQNDPRAWLELGMLSIMQGDAHRAVVDYLPRALQLFQSSHDDYSQGEVLNALGAGYGRLGQANNAEMQLQKAVELRRKAGNRRGVALSLRNLATIAGQRGRFEQAATYLQEARALYTTLGDRQGLAATENALGWLAERRGDYRSALTAYRRALNAHQKIGDVYGEAVTLNDIAFAHYQLGDYERAQALWQQASRAYGRLGAADASVRVEQNLGLLATARGRWDEARRWLMRSLSTAQAQQMFQEAGYARRNLAELELWQGHIRAALEQIDKAEALFRQGEHQQGLIEVSLLRAQTQLAAHADTAAQQTLKTLAQGLADASNEHRAIAAIARAELAQRQGDTQRAADALAEAHRLADATGIRQLQLQAALLSARSRPSELLAKLDADTAALGHAGLRLAFLELAMSRALDANDGATALRLYRQAQRLLRGNDYLRTAQLHALEAAALAANGDAAGARDAQRAAHAARAALRAQLPYAMYAAFDAASDLAPKAKSAPPKRSN